MVILYYTIFCLFQSNRKDGISMRLPNGFGSVYKLSGKRRFPYAARKTIGWEWYDRKNKCRQDSAPVFEEMMEKLDDGKARFSVYPKYEFVGFYLTRQEAIEALAEYNKDPYDLHFNSITFEEVFERWSDEHFEGISKSNIQGTMAAYNLCDKIRKMKFQDIKLDHLQQVVDDSGKNSPTLKKLKIMWGLMYDYAVMHEIVTQDKRDMVRYVNISKAGNPNAYNRKPFSKKEIQTVWKWKDTNEYYTVILMLIYQGCRIGEFLDLKKENINLEERWFDIIASKTESGIRKVPINEEMFPFFEYWMNKNDCEYLISTPEGKHFVYRNFYDSYWKPLIEQMNLHHRPHDTRHTCISLLTMAGVDERLIKKIVGHKGQGVTETVYTHIEIETLLEAINKIKL